VQAVQSDGVGEEVGDGATGSGTPPAASRLKAGSPGDGVGDGDGAMSREVVSMARHRGRWWRRRERRRCRGLENWAA
jgi:hypothetical protein